MRYNLYILVALAVVTGCRKRPDPVVPPATGSVSISIDHLVDGKALVLKTAHYLNANGDSFTVTKYRYFISNVQLLTADGKEYVENESYHLIDEKKPDSKTFVLANVPAGSYTKIKFLIGVDSARNGSGAQTGALDPTSGMFWDWNTGYIMAMLEGTTNRSEDGLIFHMGGHRGPNNVLRWVSLDLPSTAVVSKDKEPELHLSSDVAEWFKTPTTVNFSNLSIAMGGQDAVTIANNYTDMFKITHVD